MEIGESIPKFSFLYLSRSWKHNNHIINKIHLSNYSLSFPYLSFFVCVLKKTFQVLGSNRSKNKMYKMYKMYKNEVKYGSQRTTFPPIQHTCYTFFYYGKTTPTLDSIH